MKIRELCEIIDLPGEVTEQVLEWNALSYQDALEHYWNQIQNKSHWEAALKEVKDLLTEDQQGLSCLAFMLHICLRTYQQYQILGISKEIFRDTMGCFSRFVKEHHESFGCYGFDREWWTARELSLKEFRLGELEYELTGDSAKKSISIHIPSDARLGVEECRESYQMARRFFKEYAGDYQEAEYYCQSWLLSPNLSYVLSENSKILRFQKSFQLDSFDPEDKSYKQWVFKKESLPLEEVPQNTSLQRRMKEYLSKGGIIGAGKGHLTEKGFY